MDNIHVVKEITPAVNCPRKKPSVPWFNIFTNYEKGKGIIKSILIGIHLQILL